MAGPRPAMPKLTSKEFFNLVNGPYVKIFVGDCEEPYNVSRDLLAFYSPYFAACFRPGAWKEGVEGALRLPDENPDFLDTLMDYIRTGTSDWDIYIPCIGTESQKLQLVNDEFDHCIKFIKFCDKYDVCEAASVVAESLGTCLDFRFFTMTDPVRQEQFKFIFSRLHDDNPVLITLSRFLAKVISEVGWRSSANDFIKEDNKIAANVLKALMDMSDLGASKSITRTSLVDRNLPSYVAER